MCYNQQQVRRVNYMKKYITPEINLIKALQSEFCGGVVDTSTDDLKFGYVQLEGEDELGD